MIKSINSFTLTVVMEYKNVDYKYSITVEVEPAKAALVEEQLIQCWNKNQNLFYTNLKDNTLPNISAYFSTGKQGKGQHFSLNYTTQINNQIRINPYLNRI